MQSWMGYYNVITGPVQYCNLYCWTIMNNTGANIMDVVCSECGILKWKEQTKRLDRNLWDVLISIL